MSEITKFTLFKEKSVLGGYSAPAKLEAPNHLPNVGTWGGMSRAPGPPRIAEGEGSQEDGVEL